MMSKDLEIIEEIKGTDNLEDVCQILHRRKDTYDWVGIYLVGENHRLELGPFVGEDTEHKEIPFGSGVCGRVAVDNETIIVDDVSREQEYLSCSPKVKSEIVVPIIKEGIMVGEIDVDSHTLNAFGNEDEALLKEVAELIVKSDMIG